jgi:hypothetical protein
MSTCCWECTSWVRDGRGWAAWWGSLRGRDILQAARRRECATGGVEADMPCCYRAESSCQGVVLPEGMRAPRGEKFWQYGSREGRLESKDIGRLWWSGSVHGADEERTCQRCVVWATAGLEGS